jgi:hypothetical protein
MKLDLIVRLCTFILATIPDSTKKDNQNAQPRISPHAAPAHEQGGQQQLPIVRLIDLEDGPSGN